MVNIQYIKKYNKIKILNLIRENGKLSRADAAKISGISAPTVSRIIDNLVSAQLIREVGVGTSSGGRPPTLLEFNGEANFVIGIELAPTYIYGVLTNLNAEVMAELRIKVRVNENFDVIISRTAKMLSELSSYKAKGKKKILAAGVILPGRVHLENTSRGGASSPHWSNTDVIDSLEKRCQIPILCDSISRVIALGELKYGIGAGIKNFIVIHIGYHISAGIILEGEPLLGPNGMDIEFGHITLDKDSTIQCDCGNYGCLQSLASGQAIAENAKRQLQKGIPSLLHEFVKHGTGELTDEIVFKAARKGDDLALRLCSEAAEFLGIGIAGLINLFTPEAVVIGGSIIHAGVGLLDQIHNIVQSRALKNYTHNLAMLPFSHGSNATTIAAVAMILHEVLHLNDKITITDII